MGYIKNDNVYFGGLGKAWGLAEAAPVTAGATAVSAIPGGGVIAAPMEAASPTTYPAGYPAGYPSGYPMQTPIIMQAPMQAPQMAPAGSTPSGISIITKLPVQEIEAHRRMLRRPVVKAQLGRLGMIAALIGIGLLVVK